MFFTGNGLAEKGCMREKRKKKIRPVKTRRVSFPSDEKVISWLPLLMDAYFIVEKGVAGAIESEQGKGRRLACHKGCSYCCSLSDIPVYPLELMGLSWYAAEKIIGSPRETLIRQLYSHHRNDPCPFLINGECSIHLMRPMACRQFNVFQKLCSEGEDPYYTRPEDLLPPVKRHVDQAFFIMLPFHGVEKESERIRAVESGAMHRFVKNMPECNWKMLAERMQDFDLKKTTGKVQ